MNRFWKALLTGGLVGAGLGVMMVNRSRGSGNGVMGEEMLREGSRGAVHKVSRIVSKREVVRHPAVSVVRSVARRFGMDND